MVSEMEAMLFGGKGPKGAFKKDDPIGRRVGGYVTKVDIRAQTDMATGKTLYWDDGNEKKEIVVTVQTPLREDAEDDGLRRFFLKASSEQLRAVSRALDAVEQREVKVGGYLEIAYIGDGTSSVPGWSAPKLYEAVYTPPSVAGQAAVMATVAAPATPGMTTTIAPPQAPGYAGAVATAAPQAPAYAPATAPAPAASTSALSPAAVAQAMGISPEALAAIQELTRQQNAQNN